MESGATIVQWGCTPADNQTFEFRPTTDNDGYYAIVAKHSGKCLGVDQASMTAGANLVQWDCNGTDSQRFRPVFNGTDAFALVAKHSQLCLDIWGGVTAPGYGVIQWDCQDSANQKFQTSALKLPTNGPVLSTMDQGHSDFAWELGQTFTQEFTVQASGFPVELGVRMGSNQNPYHARVIIQRDGVVLLDHVFLDKVQRFSDWATVFPLKGINTAFQVGDKIKVSIMPYISTGFAAVLVDNPNWPRADIKGYGKVALKFYVQGAAAPDTSPYPERESLYIRSNVGRGSIDGGGVIPMGGGNVFTQSFVALQTGVPTQLCIRMGAPRFEAYDIKLSMSVGAEKILDKEYRVAQSSGDYCTNFDLSSVTRKIVTGEIVSFTFLTGSSLNMSYVPGAEIGMTPGPVPSYGNVALEFYLK